jgi:hypothetical protein
MSGTEKEVTAAATAFGTVRAALDALIASGTVLRFDLKIRFRDQRSLELGWRAPDYKPGRGGRSPGK